MSWRSLPFRQARFFTTVSLTLTALNDLALALEASGLAGGFIGQVQVELWDMYAEGFLALGTGISAFPSVHVAMATVIALYVSERSVWLIPVAGTYLAAILVLSVHTGFHYAVDGYASIFLVAIAWRWLRPQPTIRLRPLVCTAIALLTDLR